MRETFQTLSHEPLVWKDDLPPGFAGVRLPGGTLASASGDFGSLCTQEFQGDNFSIRYTVFNILKSSTFNSHSNEDGLHVQIVLKGSLGYTFNGFYMVPVKSNQFLFLLTSHPVIKTVLEKTLAITFEAFFSQNIIKELIAFHPSLNKIIIKHQQDQVLKKKPKQLRADFETMELVHSILNCRYEKDFRRLFFETRIRDLLFKFLLLNDNNDIAGTNAGDKEIRAVYEAETIINADISKHFRIPELSKKVRLNEFRFKALFKKIFGVGPYEYLIKQRMKKAKELLEQGYSVKEVAAQTGYRPSDFTTVFRQQFGIKPSTLKKRDS